MLFNEIQIKRIAKEVAAILKDKYPISVIILFGSYANGLAKEWSDIDMAFISDNFKRMSDYQRSYILLEAIHQIDLPELKDIEPVGLTWKEYKKPKKFSLASQIKKTGKVIHEN